ncbi:MAG: hypothetical protein ABSG53_04125, partial [Thermoguttaceae bacterium]
GGSPTLGPAGPSRSAPRIPYLPSPKRGTSKSALESDGENNPGSDSPAKPAGPRPPGSGHSTRKTAAEKAIDGIDPYDPAEFNNQANAPTTLPTPAARVLHGN